MHDPSSSGRGVKAMRNNREGEALFTPYDRDDGEEAP